VFFSLYSVAKKNVLLAVDCVYCIQFGLFVDNSDISVETTAKKNEREIKEIG